MKNITDIARKAQVSIATVSRVFNGSDAVAPETAERVLAVARQMNYQPNTAARNLRRQANGKQALQYTVGLAVSSLCARAFFTELMAGVESELRRHGFRLQLLHVEAGSSLLPLVEPGDLDAIITHASLPREEELSADFPLILLDSFRPGQRAYSVVPDYRRGIFQVVRALLDSGRCDIALSIKPDLSAPEHDFSSQIFLGCRDAFSEAGVPFDESLIKGGAYTTEEGHTLWTELFARGVRPQVIIANDAAAIGIMRAAADAGIAVPADIAVHGIDGLSIGAYCTPSLSTIDVQALAIGRRAAELIVAMLKNDQVRVGMELCPTTLIERESCPHGQKE